MRRRPPPRSARSWPDPPAVLLSGFAEDWITPEDIAHAERDASHTTTYPPMSQAEQARERLGTTARINWFRARTHWLLDHDVPNDLQHEVIPTRWPRWSDDPGSNAT